MRRVSVVSVFQKIQEHHIMSDNQSQDNARRIERLGSRYQSVWDASFYAGGRARQGQTAEIVIRAFFSTLLEQSGTATTETIGTIDQAMSIALDAGERFAKGPALSQ